MTPENVAPETLRSWLQSIDSQLASVALRMEPLLDEQASLNERRLLIQNLLASVTGTSRPLSSGSLGSESVRERIHRQAIEVLTAMGRPLHINELHTEFQKRGFAIPGLGNPANITVHLANWDDIVSPERGIYGLTSQGTVGRKPASSRRKRR